ncbi:hypothetical protein pipiens_008510 [Culex pipiens pipiens]|uniref:Uncharacterized protein n=1 Tax=Culex pipiens pipiens TaxID=38569 RepID=A0ABD1DH94_CULPP
MQSALQPRNNDSEREVAMKRNRTFSTPKPVTVIHTSAAEHRFDSEVGLEKETHRFHSPAGEGHPHLGRRPIDSRDLVRSSRDKAGCSNLQRSSNLNIPWPRSATGGRLAVNRNRNRIAVLPSNLGRSSRINVVCPSWLRYLGQETIDRWEDWPQGETTPGSFAIMRISATEEIPSVLLLREVMVVVVAVEVVKDGGARSPLVKTIDDSHLTTPRRDRGEVHARWNLETAGGWFDCSRLG